MRLRPVHCQGCGRLLGVSSQSRSPTMFCTDWYCPLVPAAQPTDDRDGLIAIQLARGENARKVAQIFGLSHQRVYQIGSTP